MTLESRISLVLFCTLLGALLTSADFNFEPCENGVPPPLSLGVENCTNSPCYVNTLTPVSFSISFKLDRPVSAIPVLIESWYTRWVNTTLSEDACLNLDPPTCPSVGEIVSLTVENTYIRTFGHIITEFTAYDENSKGLACGRFEIWANTPPPTNNN